MKKRTRPFRIGAIGFVTSEGDQWVRLYLMRKRLCLYGSEVMMDGTPEQNRRRIAIVWKLCRMEARKYREKRAKRRRRQLTG